MRYLRGFRETFFMALLTRTSSRQLQLRVTVVGRHLGLAEGGSPELESAVFAAPGAAVPY